MKAAGSFMQPLHIKMRAEVEQHIHQSAAALSAAQIDFLWLGGTDPPCFLLPSSSKIQFSTRLFCCSHLFLYVGKVTQSMCVCHTLPQFFLFVVFCPSCTICYPQRSNNTAPKTSAGTNENQLNQIRTLLFYHLHISAHMCTYKYVE